MCYNSGDNEQPDSSSDDEPFKLSQIEAETEELAHCDICKTRLGPETLDTDGRAFRCYNCELSKCLSVFPLYVFNGESPQEWNNISREWGEQLGISDLMSTMEKICGVWERGWQTTTLAEEGLIFHLGHKGASCLWPLEPPTPMTVIDRASVQTVNIKFCGCGNFEPGPAGTSASSDLPLLSFSIREIMDAPTLSFRASRYFDTSVGMDGEGPDDSTRIGDRGIFISDDGERLSETLRNVTFKKRRLRLRPDHLNDSLAQWIPVLGDDESSEDLHATLDSISANSPDSRKRKTYDSSDNPIAEFPKVQQEFLEEMLRLSGLGDSIDDRTNADPLLPDRRIFRCRECGEFLQCKNCCLDRHAMTPLHLLKEWTGHFWTDNTLKSLGLVYQLGHQGGRCVVPDTTIRSMVVMDTTGIHDVRYRRCGCDRSDTLNPLRELLRNGWFPASATDPDSCATYKVLDTFRYLNVVGNINAHDFVTVLERMTSVVGSTGMTKIPDRYKAFLWMSREYAFLLRCKRAGRAHDPKGLAATKQGECAVVCWACPYDGRNLPADWRDVQAKYRLTLAMDANFKLKNRIRVNEREDPSLGPGWGAFVEPSKYKAHLKHYVAEKDVSTCIAFAALTQKETRNTAGLRVSGVGACVCARHECVCPNGLGDLQKGERYANMDFIVMSSLAGFNLKELTISYDIACQWRKHLLERIEKLPEDMRLDFESFLFQCGLPIWHASSHEAECTNRNSLSFLPGVGKTDGEGIERLWADLNAFAYHTKTMGLGHRADTIEDKVNYHNFTKNLAQAKILQRKLMSIDSEVRVAWQERVDAYHRDETKPNPYLLNVKGIRSYRIGDRVALKKDEEEAAAKGVAPLHGTSATAFLTAGLQLEDTQRRIKAQIAGMTLVTADRESKIQEHRLALQAKLRPFRALQQIYTPGAVRAVERAESSRDPDAPVVKPENMALFLPSALTDAERTTGCQDGLAEMEARLREAQCNDALVKLRSRLHAKRHVLYWKSSNITGQTGATRSQTLIGQITDRINATVTKYRDARRALLSLKGANHAPHLKPLKEADLTLDGDVKDDESTARKKLSMIAAGKGARTPRHISGTSRKVMSWIWAARGALDAEEHELHDSLFVEWANAKARKNRWDEEVNALREEMRRVLRYLTWDTAAWDERAEMNRDDVPVAVQAGLKAYARQQAHFHRSLGEFYFKELSVPLGTAAAALTLDAADLPSFFAEESNLITAERE
ncbi:hypothetical protein B0H13DRAFT_2369770 [Mycena leptocephala]|nr:hypothetical protein B0H13DRAFT_2369770 [Mycena leptocephala]